MQDALKEERIQRSLLLSKKHTRALELGAENDIAFSVEVTVIGSLTWSAIKRTLPLIQ